jgi:hypothetical protein
MNIINKLFSADEKHEEAVSSYNSCSICKKGFRFRKRVVCEDCEISYCSEHCIKEISGIEGLKIVCDTCYQRFLKNKIQQQFAQELEQLKQELMDTKELKKRVERSVFEKTAELSTIENQIYDKEAYTKKKISNQKLEIKYYTDKIYTIEENNKTIDKEIKNSLETLDELDETYKKTDEKLSEITKNLESVKYTKIKLSEEFKTEENKIKYCLEYERINGILCEPCQFIFRQVYNARVQREGQDPNESNLSSYKNPGVLESVRDMQESLNIMTLAPQSEISCIRCIII